MLKIYHLTSCTTCQRILAELSPGPEVILQDIKTDSITAQQLDQMKNMAGSYENLFSRRAMKYRAWGLHEQSLGEDDYKKHILEEYTFLKRPVMIFEDEIFVGNAKKVVEAAKQKLMQIPKI